MDRAADQTLGLGQVGPPPGQEPSIYKRIDGVSRASTGTVIIGLCRTTCQPGWPVIDQTEHGPASVIHGDDPVGQAEDRLSDPGGSRQIVIMQKSRCVVVFITRSAA